VSTTDVVVRRTWLETPEVKAFELVAAEGEELPTFSPGAHIDVHIADGLTRQYSICNGPGEQGFYLIGVKRELESRGGSAAMHEAIGEGSTLRLGGPRNNFPLVEEAPLSLLLAGGIGVTPLVSMARHLAARSRSFTLHHFVRDPQQTAFRELLAHEGLVAHATYHYGLVPPGLDATLEDVLAAPLPGANLYLCGPKPFMDLVQAVARGLGWADGAIHLEYFAGPSAFSVLGDGWLGLPHHMGADTLGALIVALVPSLAAANSSGSLGRANPSGLRPHHHPRRPEADFRHLPSLPERLRPCAQPLHAVSGRPALAGARGRARGQGAPLPLPRAWMPAARLRRAPAGHGGAGPAYHQARRHPALHRPRHGWRAWLPFGRAPRHAGQR
jgi:ferredoxin-NADP reductase